MQGDKKFESRIYYNISIDEIVPQDHLLKKLNRLFSLEWIKDETKSYYSHTGKPSIDPIVLVKMLIIGYLYDIRSERRLVEDMSLNLAYRWYIGYDIDEKVPDHSIFTKARKRFGKKLFTQIFEEVLIKCIQAGLVSAKEVLIDSTMIKANASINSLIDVDLSPEEYWRELEESEIQRSLPGIKPKEKVSAQIGSHFRGGKIDEDKMGKRRRNVKAKYLKKRSKTDPDATLHYRPGMSPMLSYKAHIMSDSSGIITAVTITPSACHDSAKTPDLIRQHEKLLKTPTWVSADTKYGTQECLGYLQEKGIKTAIKPAHAKNRPGYYQKDAFRYDLKCDHYICPAGKILKRRAKNHHTNQIMYKAKKEDCMNCTLKSNCMKPHGIRPRIVTRFDNDYYERANSWYHSFIGKRLYILRKTVMEGIFGEAKAFHGLSRAKQRGMDNVEIQLLLTATALNLKRLFKRLDRESLKNAMQKIENQLQYFFFSFLAQFKARLSIC